MNQRNVEASLRPPVDASVTLTPKLIADRDAAVKYLITSNPGNWKEER